MDRGARQANAEFNERSKSKTRASVDARVAKMRLGECHAGECHATSGVAETVPWTR